MTQASVYLVRWRTKLKLTQREAAAVLGVTQAGLSNWERDQQTPSVLTALMIEERTKGAVPVRSWGRKAPSPPVTRTTKNTGT